ncbi:MAG: hypothetical protein PHS82_14420, partial [Lachnospiraceae bacterium]|nr:hypothetical protein [Lachnospiraceae bacterium]
YGLIHMRTDIWSYYKAEDYSVNLIYNKYCKSSGHRPNYIFSTRIVIQKEKDKHQPAQYQQSIGKLEVPYKEFHIPNNAE